MTVSGPAPTAVEGVYYSRDDYAGFWRRLLVDVVDFAVVLVLVVVVTIGLSVVTSADDEALPQIFLWSGVVVSFLYFVLLKRSSFRTPGYQLGRVRIVSLRGERPSIGTLTLRWLFLFFGPLNMLFDMLWLTGDRYRQALRDKVAHTYVIRHPAVVAGHGPIGYATYTILGTGLLFPEVRTPESHHP